MTTAFREKAIAKRLKLMAMAPEIGRGTTGEEGANWEVRTPAEGIDAYDGESDEMPSAMCLVWYIVDDGETIRREPMLVDGEQLALRVGNRASTPIGGDRYVSATRYVGGALIVTFDECDG